MSFLLLLFEYGIQIYFIIVILLLYLIYKEDKNNAS